MAQSRNSIKAVGVLGRVSFVRPCRRVRVEMSPAERENTRARGIGGMECSPELPVWPCSRAGTWSSTPPPRAHMYLSAVPARRDARSVMA